MLSNKRLISVGLIFLASTGSTFGATFYATTNATASQKDLGSPPDPHSASGAAPVAVASHNAWANVVTSPYRPDTTISVDAQSSANAAADFGLLRVSAVQSLKAQTANPQSWISNDDGAWAEASAEARVTDSLVIRAAGIADGTPGSLTGAISVSGSTVGTITGDNSEQYGWRLMAQLGWGGLDLVHYINGSGSSVPVNGATYSDGGLYTITTFFYFGVPMNLRLDATASTRGHALCSFLQACTNIQSFSADLSHTITWQGISVTDGNGHAVQNFTAWNATNDFNYASAVPEPSKGMLLGIGLAALLVFVDRRRVTR
ncbi:MAG: hypothetical protein EKK52_10270 [Burkholderiales bacterium]|uniref:hypothetical protein n=1 Tax=Roseateles sp. TaxID=1971397 RepID=UPI000FB3F69C|nr:MAG: hypothetical protein EKK52_10270 [Burkholderiales bacterium]